MNDKILIPVISEMPSKTEIEKVIRDYFLESGITEIEKYVTFKVIENIAKIGIKYIPTESLVESALEYSGGEMKFDLNGATVQITKERITETVKKYTYSDKVTALRTKNEIKISELEIKIKALKKEIADFEIHEINSGIAKEITESLTGEAESEKLGIKITLPK